MIPEVREVVGVQDSEGIERIIEGDGDQAEEKDYFLLWKASVTPDLSVSCCVHPAKSYGCCHKS